MHKDFKILESRKLKITQTYLDFIDLHIEEVVNGHISEFMELNQIAQSLAISHQHLTDTVQKQTGHHPCFFYDEKIILKAKEMLGSSDKTIADIARTLTYDPSNFSKFFKKWTGITPTEYRKTNEKT